MTEKKRVAVVTGAGSGIGAAVAEQVAACGRDVALFDVDEAALIRTRKRVEARGARALIRVGNACDHASVVDAFTYFRSELGPIHILANVVGGIGDAKANQPVDEIPDHEWDSVMDLNLRSTFECTRAAVPDMKKESWGRIVNVASVAGRTRSLFNAACYAAAKGAVIGFTRQLGYELAPFGISVNVVAPGVTMSERVADKVQNMPAARREMIERQIPAGRFGTVEEVAAAITFLTKDEAAYVCGAVVDVNGGLFIG